MLYNFLKNKKILILLLFIFLFLGFFSFVFAAEVPLPGWDPEAVERKNLLPEYIRWLFEYSITIAGLIAFGALIYAGFSYLTSTGDPSKITDAKDRISAALLGLAILLGSHLILTTIDPHLVVLRPPILPAGASIILYDANNNHKIFRADAFEIKEGFNAVRYKIEGFTLEDIQDAPNRPRRIKITVYPEKNHKGEARALETIEGSLSNPRSLRFTIPELPFDFAFTIEPAEATIKRTLSWWPPDTWGKHAVNISLRTELKSGTSPEEITFVVKDLPVNIRHVFYEKPTCTPSCNIIIQFISNGAAIGSHQITIEARYKIVEGQTPRSPETATLNLTIEDW